MELERRKYKIRQPSFNITKGKEATTLQDFHLRKNNSDTLRAIDLKQNFFYVTKNEYDYKLGKKKAELGFKYK